MIIKQLNKYGNGYPEAFSHLHNAPTTIFQLGANINVKQPHISIVGTRRPSAYGRAVTEQMATYAAHNGIVVVSGLAIGVDGIAHQAALKAGGKTIAVLPRGVDSIYPARHRGLAQDILAQGGTLLSEYPSGSEAHKSNFIARNRLVAALGEGLLITEAATRSGTSTTAQFALEQGKTVMVVPGNITSPLSAGTNTLLKVGATPITKPDDILHALGYTPQEPTQLLVADNENEATIIALLRKGISHSSELQATSGLSQQAFMQTMSGLEIRGVVQPQGAHAWITE